MDEILEKLNINQGVFDELNGIKLLDLIKHPKYLDKIDEETMKDIEEEEEYEGNEPTTFKLSGEHVKINDTHDLLILGFDYIVVMNEGEIEAIFNVYDLENYYYDEDLDCVIASGHETLHHYILHNKKYKRAYTR